MDGSFACPECGSELILKGLAPGRQVQCPWCEALVEVPFLPRVGAGSRSWRGRDAMQRRIRWAWRGLGAAAVLVAVLGATRVIQIRTRERSVESLNRLIASADTLEREGRLDDARDEMAKAVDEALANGYSAETQVEALRHRRDDLARRWLQVRLDAVRKAPPGSGVVAELGQLEAAVRKDPALSDYAEPIGEQLRRSHRQLAESHAADAKRAFDAGQYVQAIALCERLAKSAEDVDPGARKTLLETAESLVTRIVASHGVVLDPTKANTLRKSRSEYDATLDPLLDDTFTRRGFVVRRPSSSWSRIWDAKAPFHVLVDVNERLAGYYEQSENRLTVIEGRVSLKHDGATAWTVGPIIVRSPSHRANLTALSDSHAGPGSRDEAFELRLYEQARASFVDRFKDLLRKLPEVQAKS
jgi:hypothetical protein